MTTTPPLSPAPSGRADLCFSDAPVALRPDIPQAVRVVWERLARPGAGWTGAERVALAQAVREAPACPLCRERRAALSPDAVRRSHAQAPEACAALPEPALEAVHRITTEPGRLSATWFRRQREAGLDELRYVELVGVVVSVLSVDAFCRGLGMPLRPLPLPAPGAPTGYRPPRLATGEAWVPMLPPDGARGAEADLWPGRRTANVFRALTLVPDAVRDLKVLSEAFYLRPLEVVDPRAGGDRAISRSQMELLAGRVSALNECFY